MINKTSNRIWRSFLCFILSFIISNVGAIPLAHAQGMISTQQAVTSADRNAIQQDLMAQLEEKDVKQLLLSEGVTLAEAEQRLASLNHAEILELQKSVQEARAGGNILVTVVLVLLIIYLAQRI